MAEEDNFDIDIYGDGGDGGGDYSNEQDTNENENHENHEDNKNDATFEEAGDDNQGKHTAEEKIKQEDIKDEASQDTKLSNGHQDQSSDPQQKIASTDGVGQDQLQIPKRAPVQQGVKRKDTSDDRPTDPGATTALFITDLYWWTTDDDIRGWVNQAECEDELKEVTFSEHKVNGKSKGWDTHNLVPSV